MAVPKLPSGTGFTEAGAAEQTIWLQLGGLMAETFTLSTCHHHSSEAFQ
jgi:hypothetical protein